VKCLLEPYYPINLRLCYTILLFFAPLLIGAEGARLLREYGAGETPQALMRRGGSPARPRKASDWSGNQQPSLTEPNLKEAQSFLRGETKSEYSKTTQ
jgi:hypothetical protein